VNRRHLVLVALALVGLSAVTGAGSVSSTSADRGVSVNVADDEEAYLGIDFGAVVNNGTDRQLTVSNQVTTGDLTVTVDGVDGTAEPGDPAEFTVPCGSTVDITATAPDERARIEATRVVDCSMYTSSDTATVTGTPAGTPTSTSTSTPTG
jgi:hypothetical protein